MTTGTMFLLWLGEQVTERGIGNGISMIILASIISGIPSALGRTVESVNTGEMSGVFVLVLIVVVLGVTAFCVYCERAQRRIAVHYAKRQVGRRVMAGQTSHLPFKLNMAGVIPPILPRACCSFRRPSRASSAPVRAPQQMHCRRWRPLSPTANRCISCCMPC